MDDLYNDLMPSPQDPDGLTPPDALSLPERQAWVLQRMAAVKAWEKLLTPAYFKASQGHLLQALQSQLEKGDLEAAAEAAPSRPKPQL